MMAATARDASNSCASQTLHHYGPRSICQMFATLWANCIASQSRRTKIKIENAFCPGSTQINGELNAKRTNAD